MAGPRKAPNRTATRKPTSVQPAVAGSGLARELGRVIKRTEPAAVWVDYLAADLEDRAPVQELETIDRYAAARASLAELELARKLQRFVTGDDRDHGQLSESARDQPATNDAADAFVRRFDSRLSPGDWPEYLEEISRVNSAIATMQADLDSAVALARSSGLSWSAVGKAVGLDGEAARYRFGRRKR